MLSLPKVMEKTMGPLSRNEITTVLIRHQRDEDMLRFIGEQFGSVALGPYVRRDYSVWVVGIVFLLLLVSAANTAIVAMVGLLYMTARDGEMPRPV